MKTVRMKILKELADHRNLFLGYASTNDDSALCELVQGVGFIAGTIIWNEGKGNEKFAHLSHLMQIAAFAAGWVERLAGSKTKDLVFGLIDAERERQAALFLVGKITFDCSSPVVDTKRKCRILTEELGEVAKEIDEIEKRNVPGKIVLRSQDKLIAELVQVTALCVAWLESLEAK